MNFWEAAETMNKEQFLKSLRSKIKTLPKEEKVDILTDYEEHFEMGKREGKTEKSIVDELGSPNQIAKEILVAYRVDSAASTLSFVAVFRAVMSFIGLSLFNGLLIVGPFLIVAILIAAGWMSVGYLVLSPFVVVFDVLVHSIPFVWFYFFWSVIFLGIGLLLSILMIRITTFILRVTVRWLTFNIEIIQTRKGVA